MKNTTNFQIDLADTSDTDWLEKVDTHITRKVIEQKIAEQQVLIAKVDTTSVGFLRWNYFWDEVPFMNMLQLSITQRQKGYGKALVFRWEKEMGKLGHDKVMTSTVSNESAKGFYKKLGYEEVGSFTLPTENTELIFFKTLADDGAD